MTVSSSLTDVQVSSLTLWTGINYGTPSLSVADGQAGILAADVGVWSYRSVGMSNMQLFVWTAPDTFTPGYSFVGHVESLMSESEANLLSLFSGAGYPLQYLGIDPAQVAVVMMNVANSATPIALAPSQSYPGSNVPLTTFAAPGINGALGFVAQQAGSSTAVSVQYGDFSTSTGSVSWTGYGSLTVSWNGGNPVISGESNLPAGWSFGSPVKQADGSWLVTLDAGAATDSGVLYTGTNYSGSSKALSPHVLTQLNSGLGWTYSSLKLVDMPALIYSSFTPANTGYVYTAYQEQLLTDSVANFASVFSGTAPVSLLSLDNTDVVLNIAVNTSSSNDSAMIVTQAYPQAFYTFASINRSGLLAVLPASGAAQLINVNYGSLDSSGHFLSAGNGTLTIAMNGGSPAIVSGSDLPDSWTLSAPEQQSDGSWRVNLNDQPVTSSLSLYPQINYGGNPVAMTEHESVSLRTIANMWQYDSLRTGGLHWFSNTLFTPDNTAYDYRQYRDSYSATDVPDISVDYPLASPLINGVALSTDDIVVRVKLIPSNQDQKTVLCAKQSWPMQLCTASFNLGNVSQDGILIVFSKTQALRSIPIQVGILDDNGIATWQWETSVTARWDGSVLRPILTLGADAPEEWKLLGVQATGQAGEFVTDLSFSTRNEITVYPITGAPALSDLGGDETYKSYNKIALYPQQAATVTLSLSGSAKFKSNNQSSCVFDLPAQVMTTVEFSDEIEEAVTVTLSGDNIETQQVSVNFMPFSFADKVRLAANSGAPAGGNVTNSVYFDTRNQSISSVDIQLSGSAVFAGTNLNKQTISVRDHSYDCTFDIVDLVAESVTITAKAKDDSPITILTSFVNVQG